MNNIMTKVIKTDSCWLWTGAVGAKGYGSINVEGKTQYVHRVVYRECVGPIPNGKVICHTCDVRNCCNPKHLFIGSIADNNRDMRNKGRHIHGSTHYKATLTEDRVIQLRREFLRSGVSIRAFARIKGMGQSHMYKIIRRLLWKHV